MGKIDTSKWEAFPISMLFSVVKGTRLTKANMRDGNINFIGASTINNGITAHIANDEHIHPENTITITYNGSVGEAFYQDKIFWASDDVNHQPDFSYMESYMKNQEIAVSVSLTKLQSAKCFIKSRTCLFASSIFLLRKGLRYVSVTVMDECPIASEIIPG